MLSIVIVNFFRPDLLHDCLRSVYHHLAGWPCEVIVVSNGSREGEREEALHRFPELRWLDMDYNAGFSRANNAGMRMAAGDAFLLLNPDTIAIDGSIRLCYERLMAGNDAAAGVQLLDRNRVPQISGSYFVKGGLNHLLPIPYWGGLIRRAGYALKARVPGVDKAGGVQPVDWISGAFLMVKRRTVETAGFMDEDFFLYAEEVEWCSRLGKAGPLCLYGDLQIIHLEGATINDFSAASDSSYYNLYDRKGLQLMVSNHLRVRKQYGAGAFLFLLLNYTFGLVVFWIIGTLHRLLALRNPVPLWARAGAFTGNLLRLWGLAPVMLRNRPHFYKLF